jgi:NAD(P)-dependent dehydrogenase (short-subunit alcohol dehydrogenase family)
MCSVRQPNLDAWDAVHELVEEARQIIAQRLLGLVQPACAGGPGPTRQVVSFASLYPNGPHGRRRSPMSKKLEGKVAVITGGNSGIGLATAKEFSRRGAKVVINGRDEKTLAEAAASIGGDTLAVRADVSRLADLDKLFARTKERFGPIDVLFVNAGLAKFAPVEQTTEAVHDEIIDINFKGGILHGPEGSAATQGRRGGRHQHVRRVEDCHAERQRLCGEQGGAAVVDPNAGGGTARSQNPGERRRPRPDLDARLREDDRIGRGREEPGGRLGQSSAH